MKPAIITRHAEQRVKERCRISPALVKYCLDTGATVAVSQPDFDTGARLLVYSPPDNKYLIIIQDANNGAVITVMPLTYQENKIFISAPQKRSARRKARQAMDTFSETASLQSIRRFLPSPPLRTETQHREEGFYNLQPYHNHV